MASPSFGNVDFPSARTAINNIFQALDTSNAGTSAPIDFEAYTLWLDTSGGTPALKIRNAANSAWITIDSYINNLQASTDLSSFPWFLDEDNFASNSALRVASQQSIKAYVDSFADFRGWATFNGDSGSVAVLQEFSVDGGSWGITRNSAGNYTITLPATMADTNYALFGFGIRPQNQNLSKTTTTAVVETNGTTGTPADSTFFCLLLYGAT